MIHHRACFQMIASPFRFGLFQGKFQDSRVIFISAVFRAFGGSIGKHCVAGRGGDRQKHKGDDNKRRVESWCHRIPESYFFELDEIYKEHDVLPSNNTFLLVRV